MKNKFYLILFLTLAILLGIEFFITQNDAPFTRNVTMFSTIFLALVTLMSYAVAHKSIMHENPNKFVSGVMIGTIIKFFACIIGVAALLFSLRQNLNKPDLFLLMFIYMIFSVIEAVTLSKLNRKK